MKQYYSSKSFGLRRSACVRLALLTACLCLCALTGPASGESNKGMIAVWRPGQGAEYWRTGMDIDEFKSLDAQYFKQGFRIAFIDMFRYSDIPRKISYSAVWHPGSGEQWWRSGMSVDEFKDQDAKYFNQGLRLTALDVQDKQVIAVWRPGTGGQWWKINASIDAIKSADADYFAKGYRLVILKKHGNGDYLAVWRPGSGAQLWRTGMTTYEFNGMDRDNLNQGLRLVSLDLFNDSWTAVWRAGSGAQYRWSGLTIDEMKDKESEYLKKGLRLVVLRAKHFLPSDSGSSNPPPQPTQKVCATVTNDICYNLDGSQSKYFQPNTVSATGCGSDMKAARDAAKSILMNQLCLTTSQEHKGGCCTYKFK